MTVNEALDKFPSNTKLYVIKTLNIRWNAMRFENTSIVSAEYIVLESENTALWGSNKSNILSATNLPEGTKNFLSTIDRFSKGYVCFTSKEEAEVWKILELQNMNSLVDDYIIQLKRKTDLKIKKLKHQEKLDEYLIKYPEVFLKVM